MAVWEWQTPRGGQGQEAFTWQGGQEGCVLIGWGPHPPRAPDTCPHTTASSENIRHMKCLGVGTAIWCRLCGRALTRQSEHPGVQLLRLTSGDGGSQTAQREQLCSAPSGGASAAEGKGLRGLLGAVAGRGAHLVSSGWSQLETEQK